MHIVVFRFSAMGDVALTLPVLRGALEANPGLQITLVTRGFFSPFFENIERLQIVSADLKGKHQGIKGIYGLFNELNDLGKIDMVLDLHSVLRTHILRGLFKFNGVKCHKIFKDRQHKEQVLHQKEAPSLIHSIERYKRVFEESGLDIAEVEPPVFSFHSSSIEKAHNFIKDKGLDTKHLIGIAPFAKHKLKMWPIKKVRNFIDAAEKINNTHILLFGGGREETEQLDLLAGRYSHCSVVHLDLASEIALISKLKCMISMDSANMHIAALSGIPVVSIWGATHPGMGFSAWKQPEINSVQISTDELSCRPCTIYGKGFCKRQDFACMERINYDKVMKVVQPILAK